MGKTNETLVNILADDRGVFQLFTGRRFARSSEDFPLIIPRWFPINDLLAPTGELRGQKLIGRRSSKSHEFLANSPTVSN